MREFGAGRRPTGRPACGESAACSPVCRAERASELRSEMSVVCRYSAAESLPAEGDPPACPASNAPFSGSDRQKDSSCLPLIVIGRAVLSGNFEKFTKVFRGEGVCVRKAGGKIGSIRVATPRRQSHRHSGFSTRCPQGSAVREETQSEHDEAQSSWRGLRAQPTAVSINQSLTAPRREARNQCGDALPFGARLTCIAHRFYRRVVVTILISFI